ncbi:MAG TPA: RDD family protein [Streptosporangiaceae bacterium]
MGGGPATVYANWGQRAGAYLIDIAPIIGGYIVLLVLSLALHNVLSVILALLFWVGALAWTIYNRWIVMGRTGQSLGKRVVGIKLVSEATGQPIGAGMCFVRELCHIVDEIICFVGFLFPLWDAKAQTLADKIMTTVVIPA